MKKVIPLLLLFALLLSLAVAADEIVGDASDASELGDAGEYVEGVSEITDIAILSDVAPITPDDSTGLKAVLLSFLGNYDPVVVEYQYQNSGSQYYSYLREIQPDYVWMASFLLLCLFIFCLFRLGGAILCRT